MHAKRDFCMYRSSPIKLIFPGVIQQTTQSQSFHNTVIWTIEMSSVLNIWTASLFKPPALLRSTTIFVWSDEGHRHDNEDIATCSAPLWHVGLFDLHGAFSPACCSVFKQRHDGKTLKVKVSVRRRWSWESLTPLGIAHQPLSEVQDYIIKIAGGGEEDGWRAAERNKRGKRIDNELRWLGSTCL